MGKKALLLGAIAQSIPDVDFIASFWASTTSDLLIHRGFTHSFLFTVLIGPLLAWLSTKIFRSVDMPFRKWLLFWSLQVFIHQFLDSFNAYGTAWFTPFSNCRVSFNSMFVADPLFSIWLAVAAIALFVLPTTNKRMVWVKASLSISVAYLLLGVGFKLYVDKAAHTTLREQNVTCNHYFSTPTSFNNLLWYIVAQNDTGYFIGYRSVFDKSGPVSFHFRYRNDSLLQPYKTRKDVQELIQFSQGYYAAELWHDTLVFYDLRFGEINGWAEPQPRCVFYYYVQYPDDNKLIVQRGRFSKWNNYYIGQFLQRIGGH